MTLPFLVSVPHAGLQIPTEVEDICVLTKDQVYEDHDVGAAEIYYDLKQFSEAFITSDIARAIVDLNREADDFRKDGIMKTHTCYDVPIYKSTLHRNLLGCYWLNTTNHIIKSWKIWLIIKRLSLELIAIPWQRLGLQSDRMPGNTVLCFVSVMQMAPARMNGCIPWQNVFKKFFPWDRS